MTVDVIEFDTSHRNFSKLDSRILRSSKPIDVRIRCSTSGAQSTSLQMH